MKTIISTFSFMIFLTLTSIAQDGVRYVKKQTTLTEAKPKIFENSERVVTKDSTSTNKGENRNKNINKNPEKTSPNPKK